MMNFECFCNEVKEDVKVLLSDRFENAAVELQKVNKNNGLVLTGLIVRCIGQSMSPTVYLESYFEQYESGKKLNEILNNIADIIEKNTRNVDIKDILIWDKVKDNIMPRLINKEMNSELLENRPYREIADLAIAYVIEGEMDNGAASISVSNALMNMWRVAEEDLYLTAMRNLRNDVGLFRNLEDVLKIDAKEAEIDFDEEELKNNVEMYVLTRINKIYGAVELFNPNVLARVIETVGKEFYVIPSSIHELIILRKDTADNVKYLRQMVYDINRTQVNLEERLSDNVYIWTEDKGLQIA